MVEREGKKGRMKERKESHLITDLSKFFRYMYNFGNLKSSLR